VIATGRLELDTLRLGAFNILIFEIRLWLIQAHVKSSWKASVDIPVVKRELLLVGNLTSMQLWRGT